MKRSLLIFTLAAIAQAQFIPFGQSPTPATDVYTQKGTQWNVSHAAIINASGKIDAASGTPTNCMHVDGSNGTCGAGANPAGNDGDIQAKSGSSLAARSPQGAGTKVQMTTGSPGNQYTVVVYDDMGNVVPNAIACQISTQLSCGDGTASSAIVLGELAANGTNFFAIYGADSMASSGCIIVSGTGTSGQVLADAGTTAMTTDGNTCHVMSWTTISGGGSNFSDHQGGVSAITLTGTDQVVWTVPASGTVTLPESKCLYMKLEFSQVSANPIVKVKVGSSTTVFTPMNAIGSQSLAAFETTMRYCNDIGTQATQTVSTYEPQQFAATVLNSWALYQVIEPAAPTSYNWSTPSAITVTVQGSGGGTLTGAWIQSWVQ